MDIPILEGYKEFEVNYCKNCGGFLYRGKYIPLKDFRKAFPKLLKQNISFSAEPKEFNVDTSVLDKISKNVKVPFTVVAEIDEEEVEEEAVMEVKFKPVECPYCSRLKGGYYEGVLQLRNRYNSNFNQVANEIKRKAEEKNTVAITNEKDVKGGRDFYISDKKYIHNLAVSLHNSYGGELKESPRLYSTDRQSSKKIYRLNVLLRLPDMEAGDIVKWKDELFKVNSVKADKINAESLVSRKKRPLKIDVVERVKKKDESFSAVVTKTKPEIEILHPKDYTSRALENAPESVGKKIEVIEYEEKIYAL